MSAPAYLHVTRYTPRPVGLAEVTVCLPARGPDEVPYIPRVLLMNAAQLLELWRELRARGPVRLYFH